MLTDFRRQAFELDELQKSLKCHIANVRRTRYNIGRLKNRCAVMERLINTLPTVHGKILWERNMRPNLKDTFYAERMGMPVKKYREELYAANKALADLLSREENWEKL